MVGAYRRSCDEVEMGAYLTRGDLFDGAYSRMGAMCLYGMCDIKVHSMIAPWSL